LATGPRYSLPFRRRREQRTDYKLRRSLLTSGRHRAVVRLTNKFVYVQVAEAKPEGDYVKASASSRELVKMGWKGGTGNLPAAYLTGELAGRRAIASGIKEALLDIGLKSSSKGSRLYAVLKGLVDSGLVVPHSPDNLPSDDRLAGTHVSTYAKSLSTQSSDQYKKHFSRYLIRGLKPEDLSAHFKQVREQLMSSPLEVKA
jgi:large subunit ribosomal protein L18